MLLLLLAAAACCCCLLLAAAACCLLLAAAATTTAALPAAFLPTLPPSHLAATAPPPHPPSHAMSDLFQRLRTKPADHTLTTVLGTVVKFYLNEAPPVVVKEIVVRARARGSSVVIALRNALRCLIPCLPNVLRCPTPCAATGAGDRERAGHARDGGTVRARHLPALFVRRALQPRPRVLSTTL